MIDEIIAGHGLRALPFRFESCLTCSTPIALLSFVDGDDIESPQQIESARRFAMLAQTLPAYVAIRLPDTDEVALVRKVWPDVAEYTLTHDQWGSVVSGLLERHTCTPE